MIIGPWNERTTKPRVDGLYKICVGKYSYWSYYGDGVWHGAVPDGPRAKMPTVDSFPLTKQKQIWRGLIHDKQKPSKLWQRTSIPRTGTSKRKVAAGISGVQGRPKAPDKRGVPADYRVTKTGRVIR